MKLLKFILTFFLFSCLSFFILFCKKKDDKNTISGCIINQQTGQPVSGVRTELFAKTITNGTYSNQYSSIAYQLSQSDGNFSFTFDNMRVSEYKLTFSKTDYFIDENIINPNLIETGSNYNNNYYIHAEAWLKIFIKNNPPTAANDVLSFRLKNGYTNCTNGCSDSLQYFYGASIDTYHICKLYGSQNAVLEWNYSNLSNHQQHFDTIWIQPADTTVCYINY